MFDCLNNIKVPSGYSSNIQGRLNMKEKKFTNLKSHDCHVLMTQLLPVVLRGILSENVRLAIVKLCVFLNEISQKAIDLEKIIQLQNDVVQCLVSFEMVFPPSFFNIMTHLLVHIVKEINILDLYSCTTCSLSRDTCQFLRSMFAIVLDQKDVSPRVMEQRRSLSFVLILLMILIQ